MVRDAPLVLGPPHQPVVTGVVDARHRARGHGELRHRLHRALRLLLRHLALLGVRGAPTDEQRRIYADAHAQIEHNKALLRPGLSFRELTERLLPLGEEYVDQRYGVAMHGVGLCDEYPAIRYPQDWDEKGYHGVLTEGMVMCVEALAAPVGGREAVKLEEQVLITADGFEQLSSYPLEECWL